MGEILFRQLLDPNCCAYTYLLGDPATGEAVLIDPVFEQFRRDAALIREMGLKLVYSLETHVHADHVSAGWLLREHTGCALVVSCRCGATGADITVDEGDSVSFGEQHLDVIATPGHTAACVSYLTANRAMAFVGDALLIRGTGRCDLADGDPEALFHSVHDKLFTLPNDCRIYPAHDYFGRTVTTVREERYFNPRLKRGTRQEDFVEYMRNLGLPHPRQIDLAVPANLRCGEPDAKKPALERPRWAPVVHTHAGLWEISPLWVAENFDPAKILDVRTVREVEGGLGLIPGARLLPLDRIRAAVDSLDPEQPIVVVCQTGARSAQAALILQTAGFSKVANLAGGMARWVQLGLPTTPMPVHPSDP